tara:strand:+ start:7044 stop:7769 length:726 start_codon:yes stop_codon:yes gene_type:complete
MNNTDSSLKRSLSSSPISGDDPEVMVAIYDAWYRACDQWGKEQARRKFARVLHEPAPHDAKPKKSILKKVSIGVVVDVEPPQHYGPAEAQGLVDKQVRLGRWHKVAAWGMRDAPGVGAAKLVWMEFIEETPRHRTWDFKAELKLAGYDLWAGCAQGGWRGDWRSVKGDGLTRGAWGKPITDFGQLELLHEQRDFYSATPHHSGDGWVHAAVHYTKAEFPYADAWGPRGGNGPKYGSNWTGD